MKKISKIFLLICLSFGLFNGLSVNEEKQVNAETKEILFLTSAYMEGEKGDVEVYVIVPNTVDYNSKFDITFKFVNNSTSDFTFDFSEIGLFQTRTRLSDGDFYNLDGSTNTSVDNPSYFKYDEKAFQDIIKIDTSVANDTFGFSDMDDYAKLTVAENTILPANDSIEFTIPMENLNKSYVSYSHNSSEVRGTLGGEKISIGDLPGVYNQYELKDYINFERTMPAMLTLTVDNPTPSVGDVVTFKLVKEYTRFEYAYFGSTFGSLGYDQNTLPDYQITIDSQDDLAYKPNSSTVNTFKRGGVSNNEGLIEGSTEFTGQYYNVEEYQNFLPTNTVDLSDTSDSDIAHHIDGVLSFGAHNNSIPTNGDIYYTPNYIKPSIDGTHYENKMYFEYTWQKTITAKAAGKTITETANMYNDKYGTEDYIVTDYDTGLTNQVFNGTDNYSFQASASVDLKVDAADLSIAKSVNASNAKVGDEIEYTLSVTNNSDFDASNINITDVLEPGLIYLTGANTTYDISTNTVSANDISVAANSTSDITFTVMAYNDLVNTDVLNTANLEAPSVSLTSNTVSTRIDALYASCEEVYADGKSSLEIFDLGYTEELDEDGDGIACPSPDVDSELETEPTIDVESEELTNTGSRGYLLIILGFLILIVSSKRLIFK